MLLDGDNNSGSNLNFAKDTGVCFHHSKKKELLNKEGQQVRMDAPDAPDWPAVWIDSVVQGCISIT